ncbi:MAG: 2-oxoglutarate dehydrogenase E1 component [Rhodospirillales bacterium]|nr:2-oxoglutarate dehydrogenase E1 component [Alphaproteobacteria bacterium]MBL6947171.1 2-oxoglutarate dehydrogenase E1 component [Rhodospirillales bacterium]
MTTFDPDEFLYTGNQVYIAEMYERFLDDPGSVDPRWQDFFNGLAEDAHDLLKNKTGASWAPSDANIVGYGDNASLADSMDREGTAAEAARPASHAGPRMGAAKVREATLDSIRALMLIRSYRVRGHLLAKLDPLELDVREDHPELNPATYGFQDADMDREIFINYVLGLEAATLREIMAILHQTYCGPIGIEFMHIQDPQEKSWLQERMETIHNQTHFTAKGKRAILDRLIETEGFEQYLDKKFTGTKRFGLDGGESLVPAMEQVFKRGSQLGIEEIVLGMAHRGRLNVLATVMGKPYQAIFSEFQGGTVHPDDVLGSGDVKYHLGTSSDRVFDGRTIHLSLTANPSHLEVVNTVCLGKVRGKQLQRGDVDREKVMALLLHGDAAFSGQGLVPEAFDLSNLIGYQTGGTIHIVINNQIGFTTSPRFSRSSTYCTDVAKVVSAPIFHVNADDPEAVVHCARIATEYRQKFKKDVVVDMICYRRHGHNEGDEPMFTQPTMYKKIGEHPTTRDIYAQKLIAEGTVTPEQVEQAIQDAKNELDEAFEAAAAYKPNKADWFDGAWSGFSVATGDARRGDTSVSLERLKEIGQALTRIPDNFTLNAKIVRQLDAKRKMIETGDNIDWATAEALAFGSLLLEGHPVRLSGQDSGRGTFSQRHSVLVDQTNDERYIPLDNLRFGQSPFEVIDSPLSEAGVLGFEYGYSLAEPQMLILWEAQFGDFANGAQVVIDQFVSSGEHKWLRMSGLVMLLPHGFEGQGPEHSSARLERYLQLCAEDNMQVCNCSTPANYFHVLRRQVRRDFRKPLVLMAPKSLLRHKECVSKLSEMGEGTTFHRVLWDDGDVLPDAKIKKLILCTGKVYYDLTAERAKRKQKDVYILRVEQLFPFPKKALIEEIKRFKNVGEIVWCQEEPRNMGAWSYMLEPLEEVLNEAGVPVLRPGYAGRPAAASPATGSMKKHLAELEKFADDALTVKGSSGRSPAKSKPAKKAASKKKP